ncbi:MAG: PPC domain-containing protein, partial [Limisphaerales bacterium]
MKARKLSLAICCAAIFAATIIAAPRIEKIEPMAVVPGARTVLTFSGGGMDAVSNLWTSFGAEVERARNTNDGQVSFSVRCPAEASGIQALQLIGPEGASAFRLVMIDYLKVAPNEGKNRKRENAMKIVPPIAVDGVLKSEQADFYKFESKAGQSYSIEVLAHRIGSQMDPGVRVLDGAGEELAFCDDEGGVWKDARFRFTAPVNGKYTIAVHDVGYGGGATFDYRLRVSDDPLVWYTYPLVDLSESASRFES